MDKLFLLFEKGIKDNIIIIFTFADDFDNVQNLTAFKTLNDEKSPLRNILGPIENLPHFEFNNLAYLTSKLLVNLPLILINAEQILINYLNMFLI